MTIEWFQKGLQCFFMMVVRSAQLFSENTQYAWLGFSVSEMKAWG